MTESPKKVTEEQSSTSPPCTEGTEGHKKGMKAVQWLTGRGTDSTQHACVARAALLQADRGTVRMQRACGTGVRDRAGHGTGGLCCEPDMSRRAGHDTVGRTGRVWPSAVHTSFRGTDARSTDVGRTVDAKCWLNMGDWRTFTSTKKKRDTHCGRHVHMVRGAVPWECLRKRKLDR